MQFTDFCKSFTVAKRVVQVGLVWSYYDLGKMLRNN